MSEKQPKKKATRGEEGSAKPASVPAGSPMDVSLLEQMIKLMTANDLNTVDVRDGHRRVILRRGVAATYATAPVTQSAPLPAPPQSAAGGASPGSPSPAAGEDVGLRPIKSEMVGTFYSKPSPDAKPFVAVGSEVEEETVVCVIEAMKHFNPIKAETRGTIAKVLVTDGQTVDVGKPLFLVKPG